MNEKNKWEHLHKYCENNTQENHDSYYKNYYLNNSEKNKFSFSEVNVTKRFKKYRLKFLIFINRLIEKIADFFERVIIFTYKTIIVIAVLIGLGQILNWFDIKNTVASTNSRLTEQNGKTSDSVSTEQNDSFSDKSFSKNNLSNSCEEDEISCQLALWERVVSLQHSSGRGTGFIIEGNKEFLTIATASHVIRKGNGHNSTIHSSLSVYDNRHTHYEQPISACAFFTKGYADIGLIKVRNYTNTIFEKIDTFESATYNDKVIVVDNKTPDLKRMTKYHINGFNINNKILSLNKPAQPGMSGSPIILENGRLLGILITTDFYNSQGTYNFKEIIDFGLDYLVSQQNYFAPYICKEF